KAITNYHVLKNVKGYTLLDVFIETGRKNQIRVHMSSLGHPIAGDRKYGAQTNPIRRLALHANIFAFEHPFTHKTMTFKTEMPETFYKVTGKIKK
ncbi:MAG TPA: RluA family pseudouridine synthase, partial [Kandleria vitulina]|nr:RluA family pseudouridine synthase [Kandleria vitulina]